MEIVLHAEGDNYRKLKERLTTDDMVSRASIDFKDAKQYGMESGYVCVVRGDEEKCDRALELAKEDSLAEEVTGDEKEAILRKMEEEGNRASEGFGSIFG